MKHQLPEAGAMGMAVCISLLFMLLNACNPPAPENKLGASSYPKNNIGRELIPLTIVNETGHGNLYIYLTGTTDPKNPSDNTYYLSNLNGDVEKCAPSGGQEVTYSLAISENTQTIQLPRLSGVRVYFSFDKKIFTTVPDSGGNRGIPNAPAGWLKDTNFSTLFDNFELTWEDDMWLGANLTQVDMFGFPICLELTGYDPSGNPLKETSGFCTPGVRDKLLQTISNTPAPWNNLVISQNNINLRVICPYHGMPEEGNNLFPNNQLDNYINLAWEKYKTDTLIASAESVTFFGQVKGDVLTFTPKGGAGETIQFKKPTTRDIYLQGPLPDKPTPKAGVIQTTLQAAFLRSVMLISPNLPECDSTLYYQQEPINQYAKIIHEFSKNGRAYAFGFDDVCSKSSYVSVHNPVSAQIRLLKF